MNSEYVPAPYNYCDYRCHRCSERPQCRVYLKNKERIEGHRQQGEDPDDPEIICRDMELIAENAVLEPGGAEPAAGYRDPGSPAAEPVFNDYVIFRLAVQYCRDSHALISKKKGADSEIPGRLADAWDDFVWFHTLIPAKVMRLVSSFENPGLGEKMRRIEVQGTTGVIDKGIRLSASALRQILNEFPEDCYDISDLLELLEKLSGQVNSRPGKKVGGN